jgi:hypothetical protein
MCCQNAALATLPVSARTIAGSVGLVFMMASACLYGIERVDGLRVLATFLICSGGLLNGLGVQGTTRDDADIEMRLVGYLFVLTAQLLSSQRWALVQIILHDKSERAVLPRLTKVHMLPHVMFANTIVCVTLSLVFERPTLRDVNITLILMVLGTGVGVFTIVVSELTVVHVTSAVAMNVLASVHGIPMVCGGIIFRDESVTITSFGGYACCLLGAIVYFVARARRAAEISAPHSPSLSDKQSPLLASPPTPFVRDDSLRLA